MPAVIFSGSRVKTLKNELLLGEAGVEYAKIASKNVYDPRVTATDAEPGSLLIDTDTGHMYEKLDSGSTTNWKIKPRFMANENYIEDPTADHDTLGAWVGYDDVGVSTPVDGTGGSLSVLSFSRTTTAGQVLRGTGSFYLDKATASDARGEGISYDFSIDSRDVDKTFWVSFDYKTFGAYADGNYRVYVYDIDNAALLGPLGFDNPSLGDGFLEPASGGGSILGSFDATDSVNYRLIIHCTTGTASTFAVSFDNFKAVTDTPIPTSVIGPSTPFTPSWTNLTVGNGTQEFEYARLGEYMLIKGCIVFGSTTFVTGQVAMAVPGGKTPVRFAGNNLDEGEVHFFDNSTPSNSVIGTGIIIAPTNILFLPPGGTATMNITVPFTWAISDRLSINLIVKIEEWQSGALLSSIEQNVLVPKVRAWLNSTQVVATAAGVTVNLDSVEYDTNSMANLASNRIDIPRSGFYLVNGLVRTNNVTVGELGQLQIRVNGAVRSRAIDYAGGDSTFNVTTLLELNAGDYIELWTDMGADASYNIAGGQQNTAIEVIGMPDFRVFGQYPAHEIYSTISSAKTLVAGLDGDFLQMTGNDLTLPEGTWKVYGSFRADTSGGRINEIRVGYFEANGADTTALPANLGTNFTVLHKASTSNNLAYQVYENATDSGGNRRDHDFVAPYIVKNTSPQTIYIVPFCQGFANPNSVIVTLVAERIA